MTRADAASRIVAEQVIHDVWFRGRSTATVPFALAANEVVDERAAYAVRVHIDLDRDRRVGRGDYVSTESYLVLTFGRPDWVSVRVHEVT